MAEVSNVRFGADGVLDSLEELGAFWLGKCDEMGLLDWWFGG